MRKLCLMGLALCMLAVFAFLGCDGPSGSMKSDGPAAPTGLGYETPTTVGGNDGKVTGTDPGMEYSLDVGKTWSSCTGTEITGLSPCTVLVRYAETESAEAGDAVTVTVYDRNVTFKVKYEANGAISGAAPEDSTEYVPTGAVTVLGNTGNLAKTDCAFGGWNTKADGSGSAYKSGDMFKITEDTTLYAQWISGALFGEFTVGDNKKVCFSKGNMYWDGSAFKLEDNQYSCANSWNANHVNLLYWTKIESRSYTQNYNDTEVTDSADVFFTNATYTTAKSDFTVNGVTGKYRTLTMQEWQYLLNNREKAVLKSGYATVCGVHGLIILPDSFTDPNKNNGSGAFVPNTLIWTSNIYTKDNWKAMESAGAVFLPAVGYRQGNTMKKVGSFGAYTSSVSSNSNLVYALDFDSTSCYIGKNGRAIGSSVRLVCDVE